MAFLCVTAHILLYQNTVVPSISINPDFSPADHRDVAWEIPSKNNSAFWHHQHCYYRLKVFFYAMVGPHRSHWLMKAGNNMSGTTFTDFIMCVKPVELGQAHTKREKTDTSEDNHTAHLHTHQTHSSALPRWKGFSSAAELLLVCLLMLKYFHHSLHAPPRKLWSYFTAFCTS